MQKNEQKSGDWIYSVDGNSAVIKGYTGTSSSVQIPAQLLGMAVKEIGVKAFAGNAKITSVTIPASITKISTSAFNKCKLISVTFNKGLKTIGDNAFAENNLTSVFIPEGVTSIEKDAFRSNLQLVNVVFPATLTSIEEGAFRFCQRITSINLPQKLKTIGKSAFDGCKITSLNIPESVKTIGRSSFNNNELISLTIVEGVTEIENCAFHMNKLTGNLTIPETVKNVGKEAFQFNALTGVEIRGKASIGEFAFSSNQLSRVIIGSQVKLIEKFAFTRNEPLSEVIIPEGVKYVELAFDKTTNILKGDTGSLTFGGAGGMQAQASHAAAVKVNRLDTTKVTFHNAKGQYIGHGINSDINNTSFKAGDFAIKGAGVMIYPRPRDKDALKKMVGYITSDGTVYKDDGTKTKAGYFSASIDNDNGDLIPAAKEEAEKYRIGRVEVEGGVGVLYNKDGAKVGEVRGAFEYSIAYAGAVLALVINHDPKNAPYSHSTKSFATPMTPEEYAKEQAGLAARDNARAEAKLAAEEKKSKQSPLLKALKFLTK